MPKKKLSKRGAQNYIGFGEPKKVQGFSLTLTAHHWFRGWPWRRYILEAMARGKAITVIGNTINFQYKLDPEQQADFIAKRKRFKYQISQLQQTTYFAYINGQKGYILQSNMPRLNQMYLKDLNGDIVMPPRLDDIAPQSYNLYDLSQIYDGAFRGTNKSIISTTHVIFYDEKTQLAYRATQGQNVRMTGNGRKN